MKNIWIDFDDAPPVLDCLEVVAFCTKIEKRDFPQYRQRKLVFSFSVLKPAEYEGITLEMYVRINPDWKKVPRSAKLWRICRIAGVSTAKADLKAEFVGGLFRCQVVPVKDKDSGVPLYSQVKTIIERLDRDSGEDELKQETRS